MAQAELEPDTEFGPETDQATRNLTIFLFEAGDADGLAAHLGDLPLSDALREILYLSEDERAAALTMLPLDNEVVTAEELGGASTHTNILSPT